MMSRTPFVLVLTLLLFGLTGCDPTCPYRLPVSAYNDLNGNGAQDEGEQPLENVRLFVTRLAGQQYKGDKVVIGTQNQDVEVMPTGFGYCPSGVTVAATAPQGYVPTTPTEVKIKGEPKGALAIGFHWTGNQEARPPAQGRLECFSSPLLSYGNETSGYVFTPNGDLWIARDGTHGPLRRIQKDRDEIVGSDEFPRACGIAADQEERLWIGVCHGGGVASFDGTNWRHYHVVDGLLSEDVLRLYTAVDGSIWVRHFNGYSRLDPATGQWQALSVLGDLGPLHQSSDGTLWFATPSALVQLQPDAPLTTERHLPLPTVDNSPITLAEIAVANETVWGVGVFGEANEQVFVRYEPASAEWTTYTYQSTGGAMLLSVGSGIFPLADGSLFVSTASYEAQQRVIRDYRLYPGLSGDASSWRTQVYPQLQQEELEEQDTNDPAIWMSLVPIELRNGRTYYCRIK